MANVTASSTEAQPSLDQLATAAKNKADSMPWPSASEEAWRRSDVSAFDLDSLVPVQALADLKPRSDQAHHGEHSQVRSFLLSSTGIEVHPSLATTKGLHYGFFSAGNYAELSDPQRSTVQTLLGGEYAKAQHRFDQLRLAHQTVGLVLSVDKNTDLEQPIIVEFEYDGEDQIFAPLVVVDVAASSSAKVIFRLKGEGSSLVLPGYVLNTAAGSQLHFSNLIQSDETSMVIGSMRSYQGADSLVRYHDIITGGAWVKHLADASLLGRGAEVTMDGVYGVREEQHVDLGTVQHHAVANCDSRTNYRGVLRDEARTVYQGLIEVAHEATKTDAYLSNKNLLLNSGARADSIPTLRINTNDVKCSHGSTTGKIPVDYIFYLENRGFERDEAREMIVFGFFDEILGTLPPQLLNETRRAMAARLGLPVLEEWELQF